MTITICSVLGFKTNRPATHLNYVFSDLSAMFSGFSLLSSLLLTMKPVFGLVRIGTCGDYPHTTFLSDGKMSLMKRSVKAVPSTKLTATCGPTPNQTGVHMSLKRMLKMMRPWI